MQTIFAISLTFMVVVIVYFLCQVVTLTRKIVRDKSEAFQLSLSRFEQKHKEDIAQVTEKYEIRINKLEDLVAWQSEQLTVARGLLACQQTSKSKHRSIYDPQEPSW